MDHANVCLRAGRVGIVLCRVIAAVIVFTIGWFLGLLVPNCVEVSGFVLLKVLGGTPEFSTGGFGNFIAISLTLRLLWFAACVILLIADLQKDGVRMIYTWLDAGLSLGALHGVLIGLRMIGLSIGV